MHLEATAGGLFEIADDFERTQVLGSARFENPIETWPASVETRDEAGVE